MARLRGGLAVVVLSLLVVLGLALWAVGDAIWADGGIPCLVLGVALLVVGFLLALGAAELLARRHPTWRRATAALAGRRGSAVLPGFGASEGIRDAPVTLVAARSGLVLRRDDGTEEHAPWARVVDVRAARRHLARRDGTPVAT